MFRFIFITIFLIFYSTHLSFLSKSGEGNPEEHPQHTVYLDAYYIIRYEITNQQYADFLNAILFVTQV